MIEHVIDMLRLMTDTIFMILSFNDIERNTRPTGDNDDDNEKWWDYLWANKLL